MQDDLLVVGLNLETGREVHVSAILQFPTCEGLTITDIS